MATRVDRSADKAQDSPVTKRSRLDVDDLLQIHPDLLDSIEAENLRAAHEDWLRKKDDDDEKLALWKEETDADVKKVLLERLKSTLAALNTAASVKENARGDYKAAEQKWKRKEKKEEERRKKRVAEMADATDIPIKRAMDARAEFLYAVHAESTNPSESAKPDNVPAVFAKNAIHSHRGGVFGEIPVTLLSAPFASFVCRRGDYLRETPAKLGEKFSEVSDFKNLPFIEDVKLLIHESSSFYSSEEERGYTLSLILSRLLGCNIGPVPISRTSDDEYIVASCSQTVLDTNTTVYPILVDFGREIGSGGGGCPIAQSILHYTRFVGSTAYWRLVHMWNMPCFCVHIVGALLNIYGVVMGRNRFLAEPLCDPLVLLEGMGASEVVKAAVTLYALREALAELREEAKERHALLFFERPPKGTLAVPSHPTARKTTVEVLFELPCVRPNLVAGFEDLRVLENVERRVFTGTMRSSETSDAVSVVIKFTQRYCKEAHHILADAGLAPKLYHCDISQDPRWLVVVMARVEDATSIDDVFAHPYISRKTKAAALARVKAAVEMLHSHGFVFGDLRSQNVLVQDSWAKEEEENEECTKAQPEVSVKLIDFDWAGVAGRDRWPFLRNERDIKWPCAPGAVLEKKHDLALLSKLEKELA